MRGRCRRNASPFRPRKTQKPSAAQEIACSREANRTNQSEEASEQMEARRVEEEGGGGGGEGGIPEGSVSPQERLNEQSF